MTWREPVVLPYGHGLRKIEATAAILSYELQDLRIQREVNSRGSIFGTTSRRMPRRRSAEGVWSGSEG